MPIQWYPGHMNRTRRKITEILNTIDVIIEIVDARVPGSSRNPMISELAGEKHRIIVINKSDLADPDITGKWRQHFEAGKTARAVSMSCTTGKNQSRLIKMSRELCRTEAWFDRRPVRAMIVGIPNVGKSTLINKILGKKKTEVSNRPAVTRDFQRVAVSRGFELIDTPGVLWPKFEDQTVGYKLAILGSIKDSILDPRDIGMFAYRFLKENYEGKLKDRFRIEELPEDAADGITLIGRKRGFLVSGGGIDFDRACRLLIQETRDGKLGPLSLDPPPAPGQKSEY